MKPVELLAPVAKEIRAVGNSRAVLLPAAFLRILGWEAGTLVKVSMDGKRLVITRRPVPARKAGK